MSKHTPGPWVSFRPNDMSDSLKIYCGTHCIASVGMGDDPIEVINANAHLIAAAPDLYDALELFVDVFGTDFVLNGKIVDKPAQIWWPIVVIYKAAKKALAKAEGKEGK